MLKKITSILFIESLLTSVFVTSFVHAEEIHDEKCSVVYYEIDNRLRADVSDGGNHSWGSWVLLRTYNEAGSDLFDCVVRCKDYYRICNSCNKMEGKIEKTQLSHSWTSPYAPRRCKNCGLTESVAK